MVLGLLLLDLIAFLSFVFFTEQSADSQQGHSSHDTDHSKHSSPHLVWAHYCCCAKVEDHFSTDKYTDSRSLLQIKSSVNHMSHWITRQPDNHVPHFMAVLSCSWSTLSDSDLCAPQCQSFMDELTLHWRTWSLQSAWALVSTLFLSEAFSMVTAGLMLCCHWCCCFLHL